MPVHSLKRTYILIGLPRYLREIERIYTDTKARVQTPDDETELFDILVRVLQGDTIGPLLFIIVLNYALRRAMVDGKEEELGFTITPENSGGTQRKSLLTILLSCLML